MEDNTINPTTTVIASMKRIELLLEEIILQHITLKTAGDAKLTQEKFTIALSNVNDGLVQYAKELLQDPSEKDK